MTITQVGGIPFDTSVNYARAPTGSDVTDGIELRDLVADTNAGAVARLQRGVYAVSGAWGPQKNLTLEGIGVHPVISAKAENAGSTAEYPDVAPWLEGTVILQTQAGANGIEVNRSGKGPRLKNFGIMFDTSIRFLNTGHGVSSVPDVLYGGKPDFGWMFGGMENISVFGHDGNHYGFELVNPLTALFTELSCFGGGGIHIKGDSSWFNYANVVFLHPIVNTRAGGTAHAYLIESVGGRLAYVTMLRPQCVIGGKPSYYPAGTPATTAAQELWKEVGNPSGIGLFSPDFEGQGSSPISWGSGRHFVTPEEAFGDLDANKDFKVMSNPAGGKALWSDMTTRFANTPTPTIVPTAAAGTGATASIAGDDIEGVITINTGATALVATNLANVTWGHPTITVRGMLLTPRNAAAAALGGTWGEAGTGFARIWAVNTPPASTTLQFNYRVLQA